MKHSNWPAWSLMLNAILLGAVAVLAKRQPIKVELKANESPVVATQNSNSIKFSRPQAFAATNADEPDWHHWLLQLRAAGVPDKVLAGLVVSDFESRWEKQRRAMQKRYDKGELDGDAMSQFVEQHDDGQEQELRDALGEDGFRQWDKEKVLADFDLDKMKLSSAETDAFYQLRKNLAQAEHDLAQSNSVGAIDTTDFNAGESAAQKDYDQKLKTLLGDDRYNAMQNSDDSGKGDLVRTLKNLDASDKQFETMLAAQKQWNEQRNALDHQLQDSKDQSKSYEDQMRAIDTARDAEYQRVLGTNGFAALQKSQDGSYQTMQRYATAWQLSTDDMDYIYRAMQYSQKSIEDYQQRAHALEAQGQNVDWPAVEANIQEFSQQTRQTLQTYLGNDRFDRLQENGVFSFGDQN